MENEFEHTTKNGLLNEAFFGDLTELLVKHKANIKLKLPTELIALAILENLCGFHTIMTTYKNYIDDISVEKPGDESLH